MPTLNEVQDWPGRKLVGADGSKIGKVGEIYLDDRSGQPEWALVNTGLFGTRSSFVPITDARSDGDAAVMVPFDKHTVKDAPSVDEGDHLSAEEEATLYRYYGRTDYDRGAGSGPAGPAGSDRAAPREQAGPTAGGAASNRRSSAGGHLDRPRDTAAAVGGERDADREPSASSADDGITHSQEAVEIDVVEEQDGALRLRRYVITEEVITAPLPTDESR